MGFGEWIRKVFQGSYDAIDDAKTPEWMVRMGDNLPSNIQLFLNSLVVDVIRTMMEKGMALTGNCISDDDIKNKINDYKDKIIEDLKVLDRRNK